MFNEAGTKLRVIAVIYMIVMIVIAVILLIATIATGALTAVISVAVLLLSTWIACISMTAVADAAVYAQNAEYFAQEASRKLDKLMESNVAGATRTNTNITADATFKGDYNQIPAWKKVQMEQEQKGE